MWNSDIFETLSGYCIDKEFLDVDEILVEDEAPSDSNQTLFARFVWTYGDKSDFLNNDAYSEMPTLAIEFFERTEYSSNVSEDLALEIRDAILKDLRYAFDTSERSVRIQRINIVKLPQDDVWRRINLVISFQIFDGGK